jgi:tetratricopeptide (TPR) repeat protein
MRDVIRYLLLATLLMPLIEIERFFLFPSIESKVFYWSVLLLLVLIFLYSYIFIFLKRENLPIKLTFIDLAFGFFLIVLTLATFFALDKEVAFWGKLGRQEGLFFFLWLGLWWALIRGFFRDRQEMLKLFKAAVIVAGLVGFIALGQLWGALGQGEVFNRVRGLLGNAALLAGYLSLPTFLAFYLGLQSRQSKGRYFYFSLGIFLALIILFTGTRGALLGLIAGFLPLLRIKRRFLPLGLGIMALLVILIASGFWQKVPVFERLAGFSLKDPTLVIRVSAWQTSLKMFQERPVLGWGLENYELAFNRFFEARFLHYQSTQFWLDRAHSRPLDFLVMTGLAGFLAYFGIWFLAVVGLRKTQLSELNSNNAFILAGLGAYFVQNLFVFDTPSSWMVFFLVLAWIAAQVKPAIEVRPPYILVKSGAALLLLGFGWLFWQGVWQPAYAQTTARQLLVALEIDKSFNQKLETLYQKQIPYKQWIVREVTDKIFKSQGEATLKDPNYQRSLEITARQLKSLTRKHPQSFQVWKDLGAAYNLLGSAKKDPVFWDQALEALDQAVRLAPRRPEPWYEKTLVYLKSGQEDQALESAQKALSFNEKVANSHWFLAVVYFQRGEPKKGQAELQEAERLLEKFPDNRVSFRLAQIYRELGQFSKARQLYEKVIASDPKMLRAHLGLIELLRDQGEDEAARRAVQYFLELFPEYRR